MKGQPAAPASIQRRVRRLALLIGLSAVAIVLVILGLLTVHTLRYSELLHNVTTASEFNQDFKSTIDQKMYYYVIGSQYSDGLPLAEVEAAQQLARELLDTTTQRESRLAISSVLHLCENLEEKIYQIRDTESYDERQAQLENNINVITSLIQEYMYNYLYYEAVQLNALQRDMQIRLMTELVLLALATAAIIWVLMRSALHIGRSITEPITRLCTRMEQIGNGDLAKHEPVPSDIFELRTLSEGFEDMAGRLNALMEETTQKQATLRRMELALLQAQINPHFLYNTMDTIIWLIEAGKNAEATQMVSDLSNFFRFSLSKGKDVITLAEEESHVRSYLQIQQARYADILRYTIDLPDRLADVRIPKLTLQPLVENALYHGIKMKRGMGHIYILGKVEGSDVVLQVTDDGAGMSEEQLHRLVDSLDRGERVGFGLSTIHERLRLLFGEGYGLTIHSREGVGTTVFVRIPRETQKEASCETCSELSGSGSPVASGLPC